MRRKGGRQASSACAAGQGLRQRPRCALPPLPSPRGASVSFAWLGHGVHTVSDRAARSHQIWHPLAGLDPSRALRRWCCGGAVPQARQAKQAARSALSLEPPGRLGSRPWPQRQGAAGPAAAHRSGAAAAPASLSTFWVHGSRPSRQPAGGRRSDQLRRDELLGIPGHGARRGLPAGSLPAAHGPRPLIRLAGGRPALAGCSPLRRRSSQLRRPFLGALRRTDGAATRR